ncbi:unnamed protein product [Caenorhabditis angaria]|uniref:RGS domain-containing protein n=1 Tax=Caenorhabditis angaria TaxID=860376 RepID=A0A9P1J5C5_9PELO|nr:unnamed protein product [Caenorhabditis angaria]
MSTPCSLSDQNAASNDATIVETNSSRELKIFKKVIRDPQLRAPFQEFLEQQFCAENLNFYLAVEQYKEIDDFTERSQFGRRIFDRYFAMNSTEPVNIDNSTSKRIRETVDSGTFPCDTYDVAQYQILHLLKYDCWPRFLRSASNNQPSFTDEELAADDDEKNGQSQQSSVHNTSDDQSGGPRAQSPTSAAAEASGCTKEKRKSILWTGFDRFSRRLRRGDSGTPTNCSPDEIDAEVVPAGSATNSPAAGRASKQYSMPAEMTSPVKKNSLSPTQMRRRGRPVEAKHCQLMVGDQFNTETVTLDDPTMSVRKWTQEMADAQGMDRFHTEVVDAETGTTIDPVRQAIDALQSRALRLVPVVSFIVEFLPPNFSFKNPTTTPTKLICVRARHSLSTGVVLRPLLAKYTGGAETAKIVLNGTLEQIKRSISVGMLSQKCLTVMTDLQFAERVASGKTCLPAPRDPILFQLPSLIYEQNNFQFHQTGDISYCEIPTEAERSKHAHSQLHNDSQNAPHQQKENTKSLFNKFVRKASHAVTKSDQSSSANAEKMASGVYCSPSTSTPLSNKTSQNNNNINHGANQINQAANNSSTTASSSSNNNGDSNKNRLSIFNKNKSDKKQGAVKGELEKCKAKSEDTPASSMPTTSASTSASTSTPKPPVEVTPNGAGGVKEVTNIRHPAIFSTKVGNEGASTSEVNNSIPISISTSTPVTASVVCSTSTTIPSTSTAGAKSPKPNLNSPSNAENQRESTWQTAAYV